MQIIKILENTRLKWVDREQLETERYDFNEKKEHVKCKAISLRCIDGNSKC